MNEIRIASLSRQDVSEPIITQFVNGAAEVMKLELLQAFSARRNPNTSAFKPGLVTVGIKSSKNYDSVAKVVLEKWYDGLPASKQALSLRNAERLMPRTSVQARTTSGQLIDFASTKPVLSQLDIVRRFQPGDLRRVFELAHESLNDLSFPSRNNGSGSNISVNKDLRFRVNKVKCIDETDPEFIGKDSISMGGTAVNHDSSITKIRSFAVGDFDDGDIVSYTPPKVLKSFSLAGSYPKTFAVFLAIAERDGGGFGDFLTTLYEAVKAEVTLIISTLSAAAGAAIGAAIGGSVGATVAGPIGVAIGIIAGLILGALVTWLADISQDDLFEPQMTFIELPSPTATFSGGSMTSPVLSFVFADFGGRYRVRYSWALSQ